MRRWQKKSRLDGVLVVLTGACALVVSLGVLGCGPAGLGLESGPQRKLQHRTLEQFKEISAALDAYKAEHGHYPIPRADHELPVAADFNAYGASTKDPSRMELRYERFGSGEYGLSSAQKHGQFERLSALDYEPKYTDYFDCDIVLVNGDFVWAPRLLAEVPAAASGRLVLPAPSIESDNATP